MLSSINRARADNRGNIGHPPETQVLSAGIVSDHHALVAFTVSSDFRYERRRRFLEPKRKFPALKDIVTTPAAIPLTGKRNSGYWRIHISCVN